MEDYFTHSQAGGFDFRGTSHAPLHSAATTDRGGDPAKYSTKLFRERAVEIIAAHDSSRPLFLYLPLQSVHSPLQAPPHWLAQQNNLSAFNHSQPRRTYAAMVAQMDFAVGKVMAALRANDDMYEHRFLTTLRNAPLIRSAVYHSIRGL